MQHSSSRQAWRATWRQALSALTIGWDLAIPIFGGVLAGHYLDHRLGAGYAFTVGLLALGLVAGVYNVARTLQRELRCDQRGLAEPSDGRIRDRINGSHEEYVHYPSERP